MIEKPKARIAALVSKAIKVPTSIKPINDNDIVTLFYKTSEDVRAYEARTARQQDSHLIASTLKSLMGM